MTIIYGSSSGSRQREWASSTIGVDSVSFVDTSPAKINYTLSCSVAAVSTTTIEYSTNNGSSYATPTAVGGHSDHDATSSVSLSAGTHSKTYVWNIINDLGYTFNGTVIIRVRSQDADGNNSGYVTSDPTAIFTPILVNVGGVTDHGHYVDIPYTINGFVTTDTYSLTAEYSTNSGSSYSTATALTSSSTHSGTTSLANGSSHIFSWHAQTNLTNTFNGDVLFRIKATNASSIVSSYAVSESFKKTYLPSAQIDSPVETSSLGTKGNIVYQILSSRESTNDFSITAAYSLNGSSYSSATAITSDGSHSGVASLTPGEKIFVWDVDANLGTNQSLPTVYFKITPSDSASTGTAVISDPFKVDMLPVVSLSTPVHQTGIIKIPFSIAEKGINETFSIEVQYSTNSGSSFATATAKTSESGHASSSLSDNTSYNFFWDSLTDLGATFNGEYIIRVRATNGISDSGGSAYSAYGDYTESSETSLTYLPEVKVTSSFSTDFSSSIPINYNVNNLTSSAITAFMEYSTDNGQNFSTATPLYTDSSHSGSDAGSSGTTISVGDNTYVWNMTSDVGTNVKQDVFVRFKITTTSGTTFSATSDPITVNMLPSTPSLISPIDDFSDLGDKAEFIWGIPTDTGTGNIYFKFDLTASDGSTALSKESTTDFDRFRHRISSTSSLKQPGTIGITYYVHNVVVSSASVAFTYANLIDHYTATALPSSLTNPQIIIVNKKDRRVYLDTTTLSTSGFTLKRSIAGSDTNGMVDLVIFSGSTPGTAYWADLTITGTSSAFTLQSAPLATDLFSRSFPSSISGLRPVLIETSDRHFYLSSVSDSGFTVNKSTGGVGTSNTVRVCLLTDTSKVYLDNSTVASSVTSTNLKMSSQFVDNPNGGGAWPSYFPGNIIWVADYTDRPFIVDAHGADTVRARKSTGGTAANADASIFGVSTADGGLPYFTNLSPDGVPNSYEGDQCKFVMRDEDEPSEGIYSWQVAAGNQG